MILGQRLSPRNMFTALIFCLVVSLLLVACGGTPSPTTEVAPPVPQAQSSTQPPQPANSEPTEAAQAPTQAQVAEPTTTEGHAVDIHPCDLVTKEEVAQAIGSPVSDPAEESIPPLYGCRYKAGTINQVGISLVVFDTPQQAADAFQMVLDMNHYEEVSGIGDRALKPEIMDIDVIKGKYDLSISVVSDEDKETRYEKAKALAELALGRLP